MGVTDLFNQAVDAAKNGWDTVVETVDGFIPDVVTDSTPFGQSQYDYNYRIFPQELGSQSYQGHYVVININVQNRSTYQTLSRGGKTTNIFTPLPGEVSKRDSLRFNIDAGFTNSLGESQGHQMIINGVRPPVTKRIKESIALYMPNADLTFNDTHDFENISLTKFGAAVLGGVVPWVGAIAGGAIGAVTNSGAFGGASAGFDKVSQGIQKFGGVAAQGLQVYGTPINPKVEVLFSNTLQREFSFDFLFSPVNEKEAKTIHEIIRTIRFHAAPEYRAGYIETFTWVPPSEFDLTFYHNGRENTKIPRINTCALTQIDVSYGPNGVYSTFHDGNPVQIRMMLRFRETEVNHKLKVFQGF